MNSSNLFRCLVAGTTACCAVAILLTSCGDDKPTRPKPVKVDRLVLSRQRADWRTASRPDDGLVSSKLLWHNPPAVPVSDVYDTNSSGIIVPLRMVYRQNGLIFDSNRIKQGIALDQLTWKAIRCTTNTEIGWDMIRYFVIRCKATDMTMYVDIGRISDDLDGDSFDDDEDGSTGEWKNRELEWEEDVGLDGRPDYLEPGYDAATNPDPSGDNWFSASGGVANGNCPLPNCPTGWFDDIDDPMYYDYLNGTDGNISDIASLAVPDREQLSDDYFEVTNSYFSYRLNFASDTFLVPGSEYNGWATYRIPLKDSLALDTLVADQGLVPSWLRIRVIRIRFVSESVESEPPDTVLIADWRFEEYDVRAASQLTSERGR